MDLLSVASLESMVTVKDLLPVGPSIAVRAASRSLARPEAIEELPTSLLSHRPRLEILIESPFRDPELVTQP